MYLSEKEQMILLQSAKSSIMYGVENSQKMTIDVANCDKALQKHKASFVTLEKYNDLRGCIGSLWPTRPLIVDVIHHAYEAAFSDPRFPPVQSEELSELSINLSILSMPLEMEFSSEEDLQRQITPKIDGLIIMEKNRSATFLPSVWESIQGVKDFVRHLKVKAGLSPNHWSKDVKVFKYFTEKYIKSTLRDIC